MVLVSEDSIRINVKDEAYNVIFGSNLFPRIAREFKGMFPEHRFVILTDENVLPPATKLVKELSGRRLQGILYPIPPGEQHKNRRTKEEIEDKMLEEGFGRDTVLIAVGGGVIGDLGGFVAATYLRGIPYIQVPTTILAQADSSVGGKTAVDTPHAKNAIGAFKQPAIVYQDMVLLQTLPEEQVRNGLVETAKHGIIKDIELFAYVENNLDRLLAKDPKALLYIARENVRIKGTVVERDPKEKGLRRILNYGHTVGHAIEQLMNYQLDHGICVAIGMGIAGRIAREVTGFSEGDFARQQALLERIWPGKTKIPENLTVEQIIEATKKDKKAKAGRTRYCLPEEIGIMDKFDCAYATYVDNEIVEEAMKLSR